MTFEKLMNFSSKLQTELRDKFHEIKQRLLNWTENHISELINFVLGGI